MSGGCSAASVLVVDDERGIRDVLSRWLTSGGYDVRTAANADEALHDVQQSAPAVALCDIRMPGHDGLWLARQIRRSAPDTAVIMATGVQDTDSVLSSLRGGVIDYLTKPFGRERLRDSVVKAVQWHEAARESRRWRESLESDVRAKLDVLRAIVRAVPVDCDSALDGLLARLMPGTSEPYAHAYRVAALAAGLACSLQLDDATVGAIERAALLHDVGKLAMPDAVLRKPAPLTAEEHDLVRRHPSITAELLEGIPYLSSAVDLVREAQERMDGFGYPLGVRAATVALGARIIAVADAYDTMTRPRVFRDALRPGEALLELERCAGTQFDPAIVQAFKRIVQI